MAESDPFRRYRLMNVIPGLGTIAYGNTAAGVAQLALAAVGVAFAVWAANTENDHNVLPGYVLGALTCLVVAFLWARTSVPSPSRRSRRGSDGGGYFVGSTDGGGGDSGSDRHHGGFWDGIFGGGDGGDGGGGDGGGGGD